MKVLVSLFAAATLVAGCQGQAPTLGSSTTPSATSSPASAISSPASATSSPAPTPVVVATGPVEGPFAALATDSTSANYTVSIIGATGQVAATAQATSPQAVDCGPNVSAEVPSPTSTSNTRLYYLDAQGVVWYLTPAGATGRATTVPVGDGIRTMFAVSPDDRRIAVVVATFTSNGTAITDAQGHLEATNRIYVEDLNGGTNHVEIFSQTSVFTLWPIGWHAGSLVLAKQPACNREGTNCCGPLELHLVDPATGVRRLTIGGPSCNIAGPPLSAGLVCQSGGWAYYVLDWTGKVIRSLNPPGQYVYAFLSPNAVNVAFSGNGMHVTTVTGQSQVWHVEACGWIDSGHFVARDDVSGNPVVIDIASGSATSVAAPGSCVGPIPGAL